MKSIKVLIALSLLLCLTACAPLITKKEISSDTNISYMIPSSGLSNDNNGLYGVDIVSNERHWYEGNVQHQRGSRVTTKKDSISVAFLNTYGSFSHTLENTSGSAIEYIFNIERQKLSDGYKVNIKPITSIEYKSKDPILRTEVPNYTVDDAIDVMKKIRVSFNYEVNSQYNSESIYANFKRLLKEQHFNQPVTLVGNIYKSYYVLTLEDTTSNCYLTVYPYRNGSKAVLYIDTFISSRDNEIIIQKRIDKIKNKLMAVVNS